MAKPSAMFLVNRNLVAIESKKLLKVREIRGSLGESSQKSPEAEDRPVIDKGKTLEVGKLYPSSTNKKRFYYLPQYEIGRDDNGRPLVELRFGQDNGDETLRLTIDAVWKAPAGRRGVQVQAMEHRADLSLRYRIQIAGEDGAAGSQPGAEQTVKLQPLQTTGENTAQSVTEFADRNTFEVVYAAMRTANSEARLEIDMTAAVWLRTYRQVLLGKPTTKKAVKTFLLRDATMTSVVGRRAITEATRNRPTARTRVAVDRTRVSREARRTSAPDLRVRETVSARPVTHARRMQPAVARVAINPELMIARTRTTTVPPVRRATVTPTARVTVRPRTASTPAAARTARVSAAPRRPATVRVTPPRRATGARVSAAATRRAPAARSATPVRVAATRTSVASRSGATLASAARASAVSPSLRAMTIASDHRIGGRRVVPTEIALDKTREPALLDANLDAKHHVGFHFDPSDGKNRDVYVAPDIEGIHLLRPLRLVSATGELKHTVYQDNLMPEVLHVEPSIFRLVREPLAPHRPSISFVGSEFGTSDNDDEAEVLFQMMMVYRLEPWIDPEVMQLARETLSSQGLAARFVASVSSDASLELDVDFLGDEQKRTEAEVDPDEGVTDSLTLDQDTFLRLWRDSLGRDGVTGTIRHRLFDGTQVDTDARLSFWETSDELFDASFLGPVEGQPGHYRVSVRNRIESPVVIRELPGEMVDDNAVAHAMHASDILGTRLRPQETIEIDYAVTPADAAVVAIDPLVIGEVEPDLPALLRMLMLTSSAGPLGFTLTVSAVDGAFAPSDSGDDVLVGLEVEFDDGTTVELDASQPEEEVTITSRLINALMGRPEEDQRYFYRVTNIHPTGEGARTSWLPGHGDEPLEVGPAVVQLD